MALTGTLAGAVQGKAPSAWKPPRVLVCVAHPDDEYHFSVTLYRIISELGGIADQVTITDGAGGYRYSKLAGQFYGLPLGDRISGPASLPAIRREETLASGHVIGIRQHFFLNQPDTGYTLDLADAISDWDHFAITEALDSLLAAEDYDFVFTLLPSEDGHGHHKAAALLALEAASRGPLEHRPVVLAAEAIAAPGREPGFRQLAGHPQTRVTGKTFTVSRTAPARMDASLSYQVISNWVIASHRSQGMFQMHAGRHVAECFWQFEAGRPNGTEQTRELFAQLEALAS